MGKSADAYMSGKGSKASVLGFLIASSIGAALGVMFAPKEGARTRSELSQKARQLAWRFKHNREELQQTIKRIFGRISEELEQAYLEVRGEVMARLDQLDEGERTKSAYRDIVESVVTSVARGKRWTKMQIDRFISHLEDEYDEQENTKDTE